MAAAQSNMFTNFLFDKLKEKLIKSWEKKKKSVIHVSEQWLRWLITCSPALPRFTAAHLAVSLPPPANNINATITNDINITTKPRTLTFRENLPYCYKRGVPPKSDFPTDFMERVGEPDLYPHPYQINQNPLGICGYEN